MAARSSHPRILHFLDEVTSDYVHGWAFSRDGIDSIEIQVDGTTVGTTSPTSIRADVEAAIPGVSGRTGFHFRFPRGAFRSPRPAVRLVFKPKRGAAVVSEAVTVPNVSGLGDAAPAKKSMLPGPLPAPIQSVLCQLWGEQSQNVAWTEQVIQQAVKDLKIIVKHGPRQLPELFHYFGFLQLIWAKFEFVVRHFPKFNQTAASDKDLIARGSSIEEMFSIAHHLYVLKSWGLKGSFAEFGCYKGFSTSMLSEACFQLGISMDVFDSFAGLPPSESTYYEAGEFMGSLPEVQGNVTAFGKIEAVRFHKGFFADTLAKCDLKPMCLWMDVDLESSSRDVMTILDRLPVESCLFSHESYPVYFSPTGIKPLRSADKVIGPIVDAFGKSGRQITGAFLWGNLGAFWDRNHGIPVLPVDDLLKIKELGLL